MGMFVIKKTPTGFNFSLFASNKQKIAVACGVYASKSSCKGGIEAVGRHSKRCIEEGRIADLTLKEPTTSTCPRFEVYVDKAGLYRYRLIASNGESICISEEGYKSKSGVMNALESVATNSQNPEIIDETIEK